MNILQKYDEGISNNGIDIKTGKFKKLKKWHYFKNERSLCGKYIQAEGDILLPIDTAFKEEICSKCLLKLQKRKMDIKKTAEARFWETISKKGQLEIAIEDIEEWLKEPDGINCPFRKDWEGGCSLCTVFFEVERCPCIVHGAIYTKEKAKEVLKILKSLPKTGKE
ncbi:MAG: hypothetical protein DRI33_03220 [Caldiserica bacterium]|nr:MAG: hypothetical protein DRI33_03220 [Caldisericota bacterium]